MGTRSNPFEELERFFERMSNQFDSTPAMWDPSESLGRWASEFGSVAVDLVDRGDEFVATVDLPGFDREEIEIRVMDRTLRVTAERQEVLEEEEEGRYLRHERRRESVDRSVRLPDGVDAENVTARMKNGVLTITLPKLEMEEAHEIDIE